MYVLGYLVIAVVFGLIAIGVESYVSKRQLAFEDVCLLGVGCVFWPVTIPLTAFVYAGGWISNKVASYAIQREKLHREKKLAEERALREQESVAT